MESKLPTRTEAIKRFLVANTHPDLAALYHEGMEVQVNVGQDGGQRTDSTFKGKANMSWTDGLQTWYPFRIPKHAATEPEFNDLPMTYDLSQHAEGIGMTGWDWRDRSSIYVAFDFDAITGHSERHSRKCTPEELDSIERMLMSIPWIAMRKSTSGSGLHTYVFLDNADCQNHTEHAALARAVLARLSAEIGFDFGGKIDVCGGNMWVWHRKMRGTPGLQLIKGHKTLLEPPPNWRDHIDVVRGTKRRVVPRPAFVGETSEDDFDKFTSKFLKIELDDTHKGLFDYLEKSGAMWWWDSDRHLLTTHTWFLQEAHRDLDYKGIFFTISEGRERGTDINCFATPLSKGAWTVRRFTPGTIEHPSWFQDKNGWTTTYLNREADLKTLSRASGGVERPSGGYQFDDAKKAVEVAVALGADCDLPANMLNRTAIVKQAKDGRIVVEIPRDTADGKNDLPGWLMERRAFKRLFEVRRSTPVEPEIEDYDGVIRHLVTEAAQEAAWVVNAEGRWVTERLEHVKAALLALGHPKDQILTIIGSGVLRNWTLVNRPFQPEYPGGRQWNRTAAQLRYTPNRESEDLHHPTWDAILAHLGKDLDDSVRMDSWCNSNGVLTGGDYLRCWIAAMFQEPTEPLPYLFFYGDQDTGKSTFHEAISLLITEGGTVSADKALINPQGFNGELAGAVLCFVEETDLGRQGVKGEASTRIKTWVTAKSLWVHPKNKTPYPVPNTTHWVQTANDHKACPIFPGDTRITVIHVEPPEEKIGKRELLSRLAKEAPDFLGHILSLDVPQHNDRLRIPVIGTDRKEAAARRNEDALASFLKEEMYRVDGKMVRLSEFHTRFCRMLEMTGEQDEWTKERIKRELPPDIPYGRSRKDNQRYLGNLSFDEPPTDTQPLPKITCKDGQLYQGGEKI